MPVGLELGRSAWQAMAIANDSSVDALGEYDFDIVNAWYRSDGTTFDLRVVSAVPYDPATVFVEAWMKSPGGGFDLYQLVAQSGIGTLRGYDYDWGFEVLESPTVTNIDSTTLEISVDVATMELVIDKLSAGLGAGWCGGDAAFCDHFPNGWGYPYTGFSSSLWYDLTW